MSHTPGPWTIDVINENGYASVRLDAFRRLLDEDRRLIPMDDALLIAAAPDMLAALKAIADNSSEDNEWDAIEKLHANAAIADTAIAKAEAHADPR